MEEIKSHEDVDKLNEERSAEDDGCLCSFFPKRYIVACLAMFGFFNAYALRVNLSVAMVAMVNNHTKFGHGLDIEKVAEFDWNSQLQALILGSFFFGYITTQIPGGFFASKYGGKNLFGGGIFLASALTLLTPVAARCAVAYLIILRILQGVAQGVICSSNHAVMSQWAPLLERSTMIAFTLSGSYIGTVFTVPVSGILIKFYDWPVVFYFFGILGVLWSFFWLLNVTNSPREYAKISKRELDYIEKSLEGQRDAKNSNFPWKSILSSKAVWAIVAAHFCQNWGYYTLLTTLPTYMKSALHIDLLTTGFLSSLPYITMAAVLYLSGLISDYFLKRRIFSITYVRKFNVCTGFIFQAIFTASVGYTTNQHTAVLLLALGGGMGGLVWSGFGVNMLDIAPMYSGLLMGISNCVATLPGMIAPLLAGVLTPNETVQEWQIVFYISAIISLFGCFIFAILASGVKQEWHEQYTVLPTSPNKLND